MLILAVCAAVYWPRLGSSGLSMSEGHRAIPGWAMLDRGEWLVPRMFGRVYVRKPPGMFWAIGASSAVFGETEFAARAVSAVSMTVSALVVFLVTRRWFGSAGALAAGLAQALTPLWWSPGRSAEIEALNNACTQAACLFIIDVALRRGGAGSMIAIAFSTAGALFAKGPACASAIGGTLLAVVIVTRSPRAMRVTTIVGLLVACVVFGAYAWLTERTIAEMKPDALAPVVRQGVGDFLYGPGWMTKLPLMPIAALTSVLPASIAGAFAFGADASAEKMRSENGRMATDAARVLSIGALSGVAMLVLSGVTNPRYAMPTLTLVPPVVGYMAWGALGGFGERRSKLARALLLGKAWRLAAIMTIAAVVGTQVNETMRERSSGRAAGEVVGEALAREAAARGKTSVEVWADNAIEARPEVLEWCRRKAGELGLDVHPRWIALSKATRDEVKDVWLLVRQDADGDEVTAWGEARDRVAGAKASKFEFVLLAPPRTPGISLR